uniref:Uncharacterized protein n=1 Tax=Leersia perrieri TaxID=77586 RepID=A0A0D9WEA1_9ORYZ
MGSLRPNMKGEQSHNLDSSEGSSNSLLSDAESGHTEEDSIEVVSKALTDIAVKSPEAIRTFLGRLTLIVVVLAVDWDDLESNKLSKMAGGQCRWSEPKICYFLECCLEEIAAHNITVPPASPSSASASAPSSSSTPAAIAE